MSRIAIGKPLIGITMGDGAGIGPEVIVKALSLARIYDLCGPIVIGDKVALEKVVGITKTPVRVRAIEDIHEALFVLGTIDVLDMKNLPPDLSYAVVNGEAGKAAYQYIEKAVKLAMSGALDAIATAPLNKEALKLGGHDYRGHTEILAALSGTKDYAMMLISKNLRVIHVTTHISMRQACDLIKRDRVFSVISLANNAMQALGISSPRVAVAGFNPHSGEMGLFGTEELDEIVPAITDAQKMGINVTGPVPPDTVFYRASIKRDFDIVVVMYHDQGHIPLKLFGFEAGVDVTVGLPFIRTSVDHGTAFDIAGKGVADSRSMVEAIQVAAQMAEMKIQKNTNRVRRRSYGD